ncbi:MAG: rhomboid family intramembrane serine protease [Brevundimonas sp.]
MIDDAPPAPGSTLQRATDGRPGPGSVFEPATWEDEYGPEGATGIWPAAVLILAFVAQWFVGGPERWGLSAEALAEGRWFTLGTHMFVHGGLMHIWMNVGGVMALTPPVLIALGGYRSGWGRYLVLFAASGLLGAAVFLALHPAGAVPMVGASGALCGLWGALSRIGPDGGIVPIRSGPVWIQVKAFAKMNLVLFAILFVLVRVSGGVGGLAWEAHLGGFLFGLLVMPWLAPPTPQPAHH